MTEPDKPVKFVVILGNPINGITLYGPFDSKEDAIAKAEFYNPDCWFEVLEDPEDMP